MTLEGRWRTDLERWLEPFMSVLPHPALRRICPIYVAGLIGPGECKSMQPLAVRAGDVGYDQLHFRCGRGVGCRASGGCAAGQGYGQKLVTRDQAAA